MHLATIDGWIIRLREPHDLGWLSDFGRVFRVFDQQDSGNLAFGVERDGERRFVKYAGACTEHGGDPKEAVERLRRGLPMYRRLEHPALVRLEEAVDFGSGHAGIFTWNDGECLHPHWQFPSPMKEEHPESPFRRFRELPLADQLQAMETILGFHEEVERRGCVAVDFYDGSLLYDFTARQMRICDIDFYTDGPFLNPMERLWGSGRFLSPEEHQRGALIDHRTNVFGLGATAFVLLGGTLDRSLECWRAGPATHAVALGAVMPERDRRFASIKDLHLAWRQAVIQDCAGSPVI